MLKETFRTEAVPTTAIEGMACVYDKNIDPNETHFTAALNIVLHGTGKGLQGWKYHSETGKLVAQFDLGKDTPANLLEFFQYVLTARSGKLWGMNGETGELRGFYYGNIVTVPPGDVKRLEDEDDDLKKEPFFVLNNEVVDSSRWGLVPGIGSAIDDHVSKDGIFLTSVPAESAKTTYPISPSYLSVFNWTTGEWKYDLPMPGKIMAMALEDNDHVYCLIENRTVLLVDYIKGQILGLSKLPPLNKALGDTGVGGDLDRVRIAWDITHRRLLVIDPAGVTAGLVLDTPSGGINTSGSGWKGVRGFSLIPDPIRLTTPIPLTPLRQGREVQVLVQAVDDTNQGVGAYAVDATVAGYGSLLGAPITDPSGNAYLKVECDTLLLDDIIDTPSGGIDTPSGGIDTPSGGIDTDWGNTASDITIIAKIKVKAQMGGPVSGVPGSGTGSGGAPPGGGPPSGEPSPGSNLPAMAPNMVNVAIGVYNSSVWDLSDGNKYNSNGAGAFTGACVTAFHDQDARWGHIRKNSGQTQYGGHAIDACMYKNDDGTVEIYDFIAGTFNAGNPGGGYIVWIFQSRNTEFANLWYY